MMNRTTGLTLLLSLLLLLSCAARGGEAPAPLLAGGDVSMLPEIEKAGGTFHDHGKTADAIRILRDHGCNVFRVRVFVNPTTDFAKSWGATQDLAVAHGLARRIKAAGGALLLDLHYSDTWADPAKQVKPRAWEGLDDDALERKVYDYTLGVMNELAADGCAPDMVQVGNEVTGGILWPEGKVLDAKPEQERAQWERFARLVNAGARAVRASSASASASASASGGGRKVRVVVHIHGGGRAGLPKWFFEKFNRTPVDYDVIGLSFYPTYGDSLDALKQNMADVIGAWGKDVLIAETSYPWHEIDGGGGGGGGGGGAAGADKAVMRWPTTPDGQRDFTRDLIAAVRGAPGGHGLGLVWWYPEAIPAPPLSIYHGGYEALFDAGGNALPALDELGNAARR